jgi:hypothetical protein
LKNGFVAKNGFFGNSTMSRVLDISGKF